MNALRAKVIIPGYIEPPFQRKLNQMLSKQMVNPVY